MSIFTIKIIACITMILDHIKYAIPETNSFITTYFGRISYPLFAFLITEGYVHTKSLKKYYKRLILFAIISQIPFMFFRTLVGEYLMLNILFTLLLGLFAITIFDKIKNKFIALPICVLIIYMGKILNVDYSWFGVATVFVFYIFRDKKVLKIISFGMLIISYYYSRGLLDIITNGIILNFIFTISACIFICLYNGKLGKKTKYFFYWFYPVHMLILYILS